MFEKYIKDAKIFYIRVWPATRTLHVIELPRLMLKSCSRTFSKGPVAGGTAGGTTLVRPHHGTSQQKHPPVHLQTIPSKWEMCSISSSELGFNSPSQPPGKIAWNVPLRQSRMNTPMHRYSAFFKARDSNSDNLKNPCLHRTLCAYTKPVLVINLSEQSSRMQRYLSCPAKNSCSISGSSRSFRPGLTGVRFPIR